MLHDYWMYRPDPAPIRESLMGTRTVLIGSTNTSSPTVFSANCPGGASLTGCHPARSPLTIPTASPASRRSSISARWTTPPISKPHSAILHFATRYRARAAHVRSGIYSKCWVPSRGLLADNPDKAVFSQQANIMGVLYDAIPKAQQKAVLKKVLAIQPGTTPDGVLSASYYFRFYLARALDHAGMADDYLASIQPWRQLLALHFSTWPETPGNTRSDSHAWSAHPIYDLLTLVAGIEPASPGFKTVRIAPHLGSLPSLTASYPHPDGIIHVEYHVQGKGLDAAITLPAGLHGTFVFAGRTWPLRPGTNRIHVAGSGLAN